MKRQSKSINTILITSGLLLLTANASFAQCYTDGRNKESKSNSSGNTGALPCNGEYEIEVVVTGQKKCTNASSGKASCKSITENVTFWARRRDKIWSNSQQKCVWSEWSPTTTGTTRIAGFEASGAECPTPNPPNPPGE